MYIRKSVLNGPYYSDGSVYSYCNGIYLLFYRDTDTACSILRGLDYLSAVRIFFSG